MINYRIGLTKLERRTTDKNYWTSDEKYEKRHKPVHHTLTVKISSKVNYMYVMNRVKKSETQLKSWNVCFIFDNVENFNKG